MRAAPILQWTAEVAVRCMSRPDVVCLIVARSLRKAVQDYASLTEGEHVASMRIAPSHRKVIRGIVNHMVGVSDANMKAA
eukprot:CAMPEP_0114236614 /NCGR_PEP_ID=MMETSP0058-20121206/6935_1 /TAXON_ID=36894 /ORGANISM="Pyramimonas parkeae, CCMP726" /LENGTH=79 /DNA_ID=CAMNT_0001348569 /DNA_START=460 /DNA_END=699 /DNA_ORIENTATION=-